MSEVNEDDLLEICEESFDDEELNVADDDIDAVVLFAGVASDDIEATAEFWKEV